MGPFKIFFLYLVLVVLLCVWTWISFGLTCLDFNELLRSTSLCPLLNWEHFSVIGFVFFFFQILPALHSLPSICGTLINLAPLFKEKGSLFLEFQVPKSSVALAVIATTTTVGLSGG